MGLVGEDGIIQCLARFNACMSRRRPYLHMILVLHPCTRFVHHWNKILLYKGRVRHPDNNALISYIPPHARRLDRDQDLQLNYIVGRRRHQKHYYSHKVKKTTPEHRLYSFLMEIAVEYGMIVLLPIHSNQLPLP